MVGYGVLASKTERKLTIDELFVGHGREAVEHAKQEFAVVLDGSEESLKALDQLVGKIHDKHITNALDEVTIGRESRMWGAYLGNVIKARFGGTWERDSDVNGPASFPLKIGSSQVFPCNWVYKRIVNGSADDLTIKHRVMTMSLTNGLPMSNAASNSSSVTNH